MSNLATLANAYNPILLLISLGLGVFLGIKYKSARVVLLVLSAVVVYSIMFLDNKFKLWGGMGLDYSTHTATSLAMCIFIGTSIRNTVMNIILALTLGGYCALMVALNYHSWADILSTAAVVGVLLSVLYYSANSSIYFRARKLPSDELI